MRRPLAPLIIAVYVGVAAVLAGVIVGRGTLDALLAPLLIVAAAWPAGAATGRPGWRWAGAAILALIVTAGVIGAGLGVAAVHVAWVALLTAGVDALVPTYRRRPLVRPALVTLVAVAWLLWPVWLAPQLSRVPGWMTSLHPIFAVNAAALGRGVWAEQANVYPLTPLGQDVAYALPASPWPAAAAHAGAATVLFTVACIVRKRHGRNEARP